MLFTSPIWLLGLLPWAGVVVYLLRGRPQRRAVPFLELWSPVSVAPKPRRAVRRPPLFVVLLTTAMLLAVVAAAGPAVRARGSAEPITIILDRGITMSPTLGGEPFRGVIAMLSGDLSRRFGSTPVDLVSAPGDVTRSTTTAWSSIARAKSPTAVQTGAMLEQAVAQRLRDTRGTVIVLTDQILARHDDRLVQVPPSNGVEDVGIALLAARATPTPQVMVRVRNQSRLTQVNLRVTSGDRQIDRTLALPAAGETRDEFVDVPGGLGDVIIAELLTHDDAAVDDRAWLVRESPPPVIEARTALPAAVERMIQVYARQRRPSENSLHIALTDRLLPETDRGVWIVPERGEPITGVPAAIVPHAVTKDVARWPSPADAGASRPAGFDPVVSSGGRVIVAVRDAPVPQVWLNADLTGWSRDPSFVIFFSNVFDWLGRSDAAEFVSHPIGQLSDVWTRVDDSPAPSGVRNGLWPGLYRRGDGAMRAINPPDVPWPTAPPTTDWRRQLDRQAISAGGVRSLRGWLLVAAIGCATLAAMVWPSRRAKRDGFLGRAQDRQPHGA